ncbi:hypothetical protein PAAG_08001 [Paracoccidioides lutzii Pb01]|uniref:Uncharacterized protein n=1 Tax=Paracoccidioides lutzii (strain ATCC MYA-826 / Pb01) TaxID=502779 RepID=C1HB60_PARBA|nr:hypothetical protein PAAG_08001 [Paracoccidioides lutzii Pb01]EEH37583.2 hypothetical protein PAAG_08001 [Paracoccidioides lutzii Pb01]
MQAQVRLDGPRRFWRAQYCREEIPLQREARQIWRDVRKKKSSGDVSIPHMDILEDGSFSVQEG